MPKISRQMPNGTPARPRQRDSQLSVVDRIQRMSPEDDFRKINVLVFGQSGTGKTTFWSSFPGPILVLLCSGGKNPGELISIPVENRNKISQAVIHECDDVLDGCRHVQGSGDYKTVVLDHASGLESLCLKEVLGMSEVPVVKRWGMATIQDYGTVSTKCKEYLRALLNLDTNVVIVAQEKMMNDDGVPSEDAIKPTITSALQKGIVTWLNPACDNVVETLIRPEVLLKEKEIAGKKKMMETRTGGYEYCLRTGVSDIYTIKVRSPNPRNNPGFIVNPTYDKLMRVITGRK